MYLIITPGIWVFVNPLVNHHISHEQNAILGVYPIFRQTHILLDNVGCISINISHYIQFNPTISHFPDRISTYDPVIVIDVIVSKNKSLYYILILLSHFAIPLWNIQKHITIILRIFPPPSSCRAATSWSEPPGAALRWGPGESRRSAENDEIFCGISNSY